MAVNTLDENEYEYFPHVPVKEGEMWTLCGETNLTAEAGEVTSPLYPKPYPNNVLCAWNIRAEEQNTITLT